MACDPQVPDEPIGIVDMATRIEPPRLVVESTRRCWRIRLHRPPGARAELQQRPPVMIGEGINEIQRTVVTIERFERRHVAEAKGG